MICFTTRSDYATLFLSLFFFGNGYTVSFVVILNSKQMDEEKAVSVLKGQYGD